jgi:type I restriction enzyme R subunit
VIWTLPNGQTYVTTPGGALLFPAQCAHRRDAVAGSSTGRHGDEEDQIRSVATATPNGSAVEIQGEDVLAQIARELVAVMRRDIKTDWTVRDDVRAKLRSSIKRLLVKHKYPPDKQPKAIRLVIEQMESMAPRMAA